MEKCELCGEEIIDIFDEAKDEIVLVNLVPITVYTFRIDSEGNEVALKEDGHIDHKLTCKSTEKGKKKNG